VERKNGGGEKNSRSRQKKIRGHHRENKEGMPPMNRLNPARGSEALKEKIEIEIQTLESDKKTTRRLEKTVDFR